MLNTLNSFLDRIIANKNSLILKSKVDLDEIEELIDKKKTSLFGNVFKRPKPDEVSVLSTDLFFEPIWKIKGEYDIDFYRKNTHQISTDPHVKEIIIGSGVFPVLTDSGAWKKFKDTIKFGDKMNKTDIPVEEHVEIYRELELYLNSQGQPIEPNLKIESKYIENFPDEFIKSNKNNIRSSDLAEDSIIDIYLSTVKNNLGDILRIVTERLVVDVFEQIFLPVYEIRIADSKNTTKILRVDGMSSKIL
ncbi:hypothetical protein Nlim_0886 [Candidatus Nitrosarchaeum limnium SFB1]|jgi:hypothetical protein|uniref:Uncharacterized protein n=1 Tax=Candidatus Nitrosarchaeum limnium SFB1 TaxID=886738 RepID=F3KK73_9ARCH|nr:hypothetical protein Nlim_0886 [Candidatus Nitrosarchaeum limnium SFB1]